MKCEICNSKDVIMSGVDAFCYGVETERFCYECAAKIYLAIRGELHHD